MQLTKNILHKLIKEEMDKSMNIATKNDVEKHREELRKDREERRKRKEEIGIIPSELTRLGKGIMEEGNYDEDEEGYVRIPKSVLDRHLNRTKEDIALWAKQMGYKSVEEWLKITNSMSSAQKGSLLKMK
tara:strand:- start:730 stop:1119 length:390 start_codon:yes stop_codon:yes gene_type:complete